MTIGIILTVLFIFVATVTENNHKISWGIISLATALSVISLILLFVLKAVGAYGFLWTVIYTVTAIVMLHLVVLMVSDEDNNDSPELSKNKMIKIAQYSVDILALWLFAQGFISSVVLPLMQSTVFIMPFKIYLYTLITLVFVTAFLFIGKSVWNSEKKSHAFKVAVSFLIVFLFIPALVSMIVAISNL